MKIGIITDCIDKKMRGGGRYTENLVKNILKIESDIHIYLIHETKTNNLLYKSGNEVILNSSPPFCRFIYQPLKIMKQSFDIIHHPTGCGYPFLWLLPPSRKVITIHDACWILMPSLVYFNAQARASHLTILRLLNKKMDCIVTPSKSSKSDLIKYLKISDEKIRVIYNGVDHNKFKPLKNVDKIKDEILAKVKAHFMLHVSNYGPVKNIPAIIKAYYKLKKKGNQYKLVIAGEPKSFEYENKVLEMTKKLHLQNDVISIGYVKDEDLVKLYNAAELFVFPSLYEGFSLPMLEAMACGTPVIASNISSLPEIAGDAAILINPYNINELEKAMSDILTNDTLKEDLRRKGLKRAKSFSWKKCAQEHLKVYKKVAENV